LGWSAKETNRYLPCHPQNRKQQYLTRNSHLQRAAGNRLSTTTKFADTQQQRQEVRNAG
jgi:hypothetical protein